VPTGSVPPPDQAAILMPEAGGDSMLTKTARGAGWLIGWQIATRMLGFFATLLLARLLTPADFGVVAIAMSFVQAIETLSFLGVEEALIRERAPSRALYDTGFTLNVLRNLAIALLVAATAVPTAGLFGEPRLAPVLQVLAVGVAVSGFDNVGVVDYRRSFAFAVALRQSVLPRLLSVVLTLSLAVWLHSYWALIAGVVSMRVAQVAAGYLIHPYRPRFSLSAWRKLIGYSAWALAQTAAVVLRDRSHMLIIGNMLGAPAAGVYSVGSDIALMPSNELLAPLSRVAFSSFASHDDTPAAIDSPADTYRRLVGVTALFALPLGFGLSLTAAPLVQLAFGPGWAAAVPVMRVLGVVGALMAFAYMATTLFFAHARMAASFRVTCLSAAVRLVVLLALLGPLGLVGAALAMAACEVVETACYLVLMSRLYGLRWQALLGDIWRCFAATAAMALALWGAGLGWAPLDAGAATALADLLCAVPLGAAVYLAVLLGLWLAMRRPSGPEADWLRMASRALRR
jgi:O-antigen/teichoic acid export membrane protein